MIDYIYTALKKKVILLKATKCIKKLKADGFSGQVRERLEAVTFSYLFFLRQKADKVKKLQLNLPSFNFLFLLLAGTKENWKAAEDVVQKFENGKKKQTFFFLDWKSI